MASPELATTTSAALLPQPQPIQALPMSIKYGGRNILDLGSNLAGAQADWPLQYTNLPENNFPMYLANRSQYHRLGPSGHVQEFTVTVCSCRSRNGTCAFAYPVDDQPTTVAPQTVGHQLLQFVQSMEPPQPPRFTNAVPQPEPIRNQLFNSLNLNTNATNANVNNMQYNNLVNQLIGNGINNVGNGVNNMGNGINNMGNNYFNGIMGNSYNNNYTSPNASLNRILAQNHNNNNQYNLANQKLYGNSMPTNKQFKPQPFISSMNMYKQF